MKTPLSKREIILAAITVVCLVVIAALGVGNAHLRTENQRSKTLAEGNQTLLKETSSQANKSANYTDTICAEYRKLYQAYADLRTQNPSASASYALPGSAKGQVDECYQP